MFEIRTELPIRGIDSVWWLSVDALPKLPYADIPFVPRRRRHILLQLGKHISPSHPQKLDYVITQVVPCPP